MRHISPSEDRELFPLEAVRARGGLLGGLAALLRGGLAAFRTHLFRYFNGRPGAAELRRRINMVHTLAEANALVAAFRYQKAARA